MLRKIHLILACITNFECNCYAHSLYYKIINSENSVFLKSKTQKIENVKNRFNMSLNPTVLVKPGLTCVHLVGRELKW
jgi:hypothetical protein